MYRFIIKADSIENAIAILRHIVDDPEERRSLDEAVAEGQYGYAIGGLGAVTARWV